MAVKEYDPQQLKTSSPIGPGATVQNASPSETPGLVENIGHSFGIGGDDSAERLADLKAHPVRAGIKALAGPAGMAAEGLYNGAKRIGGEVVQAGKSALAGNGAEAAVHGSKAIPFAGPALDKMADESPATHPGQSYASKVWADATPGNVGTAIGTAAQVAPLVLGGLDEGASERPLLGQLPSASRAGKVFQDIREQAKDVPLNFEKTTPEMERFKELTQRGGRASKPFTQLSRRLDPEEPQEPVNFPEGRDFYSNISDAAHQTPLQKIMGRGMKPTMRRQAVNVRRAFNDDLTSAADQVGRGQDYTDAMKEYANAKRLEKIGKGAALLGAGEVARRTGLLGNWIHRTALQQ
jgi:hypothetical protein